MKLTVITEVDPIFVRDREEAEVNDYVAYDMAMRIGRFIADNSETFVSRRTEGVDPGGKIRETQFHTTEVHVLSEAELQDLIEDAQRAALKEVSERIAINQCGPGKNFC